MHLNMFNWLTINYCCRPMGLEKGEQATDDISHMYSILYIDTCRQKQSIYNWNSYIGLNIWAYCHYLEMKL